jgi:hypothetical protein
LSSPPKIITLAITYIQSKRIAGPPSVLSVTLTEAWRTKNGSARNDTSSTTEPRMAPGSASRKLTCVFGSQR